MEVLTELIFPIVISVVGVVVGAIVGFIGKRAEKRMNNDLENAKQEKEKYERLLKEEQTRNIRNMIIEEIEPIANELVIIKQSIENKAKEFEEYIQEDEKTFDGKIDEVIEHHDADKEAFDKKIEYLTKEYKDKLKKILESYKFRFIQLCKVHLKDGYITSNDWEQITVFYNLYHGLGGNGQAQDYYEKVKALEILDEKPE